MALLLRFDAYTFRKHMHRFDAAQHPSPLCDLCDAHVPETQAHALGGCQHAATHAMVCSRHGTTVHLIHEAIRRDVNCFVTADAEGHARFAEPAWLLPGVVRASTPDLLLIGTLPADTAGPLPGQEQHAVRVLEIFHTYDTNLGAGSTLWPQKCLQHTSLVGQLAACARYSTAEQFTLGVTHSGLLTANFLDVLVDQIREHGHAPGCQHCAACCAGLH